MPEHSTELGDNVFRALLSAAITVGERQQRTTLVGSSTWSAINRVAAEHPEASPQLIVAAHEAFAAEREAARAVRDDQTR